MRKCPLTVALFVSVTTATIAVSTAKQTKAVIAPYVGQWHGEWKAKSEISSPDVPAIQSGDVDLVIDRNGKVSGKITNYLANLSSQANGSIEPKGSIRVEYRYEVDSIPLVARFASSEKPTDTWSGNFRCYAKGEQFSVGTFQLKNYRHKSDKPRDAGCRHKGSLFGPTFPKDRDRLNPRLQSQHAEFP